MLVGMMRSPATVVAAAALILLTLACGATTKLASVWQEPNYAGTRMSRILVLGIGENATVRRSFEDAFVEALTAQGVEAVASYRELPSVERLSREAIDQVVRAGAFDGVVVTRLLGTDKEETYVPGQTHVVPRRGYYDYYRAGYDVIHEPGYVRTRTIVRLDTKLYDARTGEIVWGAQSDTFNPASTDDTIQSVTQLISRKLKEAGLLPPS